MARNKPQLDAPVIRDHVIRQYKKGYSADDIGKEMGCSGQLVLYALARWGIPRRTGQFRAHRCVDCETPTHGNKRCPPCKQDVHRESSREYYHERKERLAYSQARYARRLERQAERENE